MAILLKTASVWVRSIQIIQVRVHNKGKSVWKSRYVGDVSVVELRAETTGAERALAEAGRLQEQLAVDKSPLQVEVDHLKAEAAKVVEA